MIFAAGQAAVQVAADELKDSLGLDLKAILGFAFVGEVQNGLPPGDIPVLMVVHKKTNQTQFWQLTDKVKSIRLKSENPGPIELRVVNEIPLRVELWLEADTPPDIEVIIEFKQ
jgi:hypothetical protein